MSLAFDHTMLVVMETEPYQMHYFILYSYFDVGLNCYRELIRLSSLMMKRTLTNSRLKDRMIALDDLSLGIRENTNFFFLRINLFGIFYESRTATMFR